MRNGLWAASKAIVFSIVCFILFNIIVGLLLPLDGIDFYPFAFLLIIGNIAYWASKIMDRISSIERKSR